MKKIYDFVRLHPDIAFATANQEGNPAIRVFQVMKIDEPRNRLYFTTSPKKEVYRELQRNPNIEILGYQGNISVRLKGKAVFDVTDEIAREIYRENPVLPQLYANYTDLVYFSFPMQKADYYDLGVTPPLLERYEV